MWSGCASSNCPNCSSFYTVFVLLVVLDMMHPKIFTKAIVSVDVKPNEVNDDVKSDEANDDVKS